MSPCRAKDFLRVMMIPSLSSTSSRIVSNLAVVAQGGCLQISKGVVFVRGTGVDSSDKRECVNGVRMYCQQVWIKGSYFAERVNQPF